MMKIFIIGATGMTGSSLVKEAVKAGYKVIANARNNANLLALKEEFPTIEILNKDAFELTLEDIADSEVIIDAFATAPEQAFLHVDLAAKLVAMLRNSSVRIGFILGAGSLLVGKENNVHHAYDDIVKDQSTVSWRAIPENQLYELDFLKNVKNVDWFGVSPGLNFISGEKSDNIIYGIDHLLFNNNGISETTSGTMASAVISEISDKKHSMERFTVING